MMESKIRDYDINDSDKSASEAYAPEVVGHEVSEPEENGDEKKTEGQLLSEKLKFEVKNYWESANDEIKTEVFKFADDYKSFLDTAKTEREFIAECLKLLSEKGYVDLDTLMENNTKITPGMKIFQNIRGKSLLFAVTGKAPVSMGVNLVGSHVDSPRIDLKVNPLYEDTEMAMLDTQYYGGIKKYQWVTMPLAMHGVIVKEDGRRVDICIGEDERDPVFTITDLLPHLAKDQMQKKAGEVITGEGLNVLTGSIPFKDEKAKDKVKLNILSILNEKYGVVEQDFACAEIEIVPAYKARDVGLDRSMIGAYGHDDRCCAYAALRAVIEVGESNAAWASSTCKSSVGESSTCASSVGESTTCASSVRESTDCASSAWESSTCASSVGESPACENTSGKTPAAGESVAPDKMAATAIRKAAAPTHTCVCVLTDKEEVGSAGNTGAESKLLENFLAYIGYLSDPDYSDISLRKCLTNSAMLSADVNPAMDPNYDGVQDKKTASYLNRGIVLTKYTGSRGKSGASDANAEFCNTVRAILNNNNVQWQFGDLGKVDQGGGGTIAQFVANLGVEVMDCGIPVLSMHSPFEVIGKADLYMTYKGYIAFLMERIN